MELQEFKRIQARTKIMENPYCKVCGACGEEGCCSPLTCDFTEGCEYKDIYLKDLKYGYLLMQRLYDYLDHNHDGQAIKEIEDKTYNDIYET